MKEADHQGRDCGWHMRQYAPARCAVRRRGHENYINRRGNGFCSENAAIILPDQVPLVLAKLVKFPNESWLIRGAGQGLKRALWHAPMKAD